MAVVLEPEPDVCEMVPNSRSHPSYERTAGTMRTLIDRRYLKPKRDRRNSWEYLAHELRFYICNLSLRTSIAILIVLIILVGAPLVYALWDVVFVQLYNKYLREQLVSNAYKDTAWVKPVLVRARGQTDFEIPV